MTVKRTAGGFIEISGEALRKLQADLPMALFGIHRGAMCLVCVREGLWKSAAGEWEFRLSGVCETCYDANVYIASFARVLAVLAQEGDTRGVTQEGVEVYLALMRARISARVRPEMYGAMIRRLSAEPCLPLLQRRSKVVDMWASALSADALQIVFILEQGFGRDSGSSAESAVADALAASLIGFIFFQDRAGRAVVFEEVLAAGIAGTGDVCDWSWGPAAPHT